MTTTKKTKPRKYNKSSSKRVIPSTSVWGKNKPLEKFWRHLTMNVVVLYKNGSHKYISLPSQQTKKYKNLFDNFDNDDNVVAVLTSPLSQDAYELGLYPKANDKTVDFVIKNYQNYFKPLSLPKQTNAPSLMKKVYILR